MKRTPTMRRFYVFATTLTADGKPHADQAAVWKHVAALDAAKRVLVDQAGDRLETEAEQATQRSWKGCLGFSRHSDKPAAKDSVDGSMRDPLTETEGLHYPSHWFWHDLSHLARTVDADRVDLGGLLFFERNPQGRTHRGLVDHVGRMIAGTGWVFEALPLMRKDALKAACKKHVSAVRVISSSAGRIKKDTKNPAFQLSNIGDMLRKTTYRPDRYELKLQPAWGESMQEPQMTEILRNFEESDVDRIVAETREGATFNLLSEEYKFQGRFEYPPHPKELSLLSSMVYSAMAPRVAELLPEAAACLGRAWKEAVNVENPVRADHPGT